MVDLAKLLQKKRSEILEKWVKNQVADEGLRDDLMKNDDLRQQSDDLLNSLLNTITNDNITHTELPVFDDIKEILSGISISRARQGFSPRETGVFVFSLKDALQDTIQQGLKDDPKELYDCSVKVNKLMDDLGIITFETFIKGREEVILRQTNEITEISTPVIQVWDGILTLPIIGTLDSARTQVVMENLLQEIVEKECTIAILDISGVPAVDSLVAQHLLKTVAATRLMGAECIISGIRPEIAQTIVHLGIDLTSIITKSTMAGALSYAFGLLHLGVRKTGK